MKKFAFLLTGAIALGACTQTLPAMSHGEAVSICQAQAADAARTISGNASAGVNSVSGPTFGLGLRINLTPKPEAQTFENCMAKLAANGQISEG